MQILCICMYVFCIICISKQKHANVWLNTVNECVYMYVCRYCHRNTCVQVCMYIHMSLIKSCLRKVNSTCKSLSI